MPYVKIVSSLPPYRHQANRFHCPRYRRYQILPVICALVDIYGSHGLNLQNFPLGWVLGAIFNYAGGTKLLEPEIFAVLIEAYGIVPEGFIMPLAIGLPLLEVTAGIGLLFDIRGSLPLITGLLLLFMVVPGYGIWIGCGLRLLRPRRSGSRGVSRSETIRFSESGHDDWSLFLFTDRILMPQLCPSDR
jgi:hypothetical protein